MNIDVVFIHGWAMNSAVWQPCLQRLPDRVRTVCVDLPGYGDSRDVSAATLGEYVEHVARMVARPSVLVGWSLGGLVSLELARRHPAKVSALFQVATSPKFVQGGGWNAAIEGDVFDQFAASLEKDMEKTIRRFLALQVRGTGTSMQTVRELQRAIDARGLPGVEALRSGLKILSDTDLRETLQQLSCPVDWLLGDKDVLVPVALAEALEQSPLNPRIHVMQGAGHAPFISDPDGFAGALVRAIEHP